jgi:hypothetical protein
MTWCEVKSLDLTCWSCGVKNDMVVNATAQRVALCPVCLAWYNADFSDPPAPAYFVTNDQRRKYCIGYQH